MTQWDDRNPVTQIEDDVCAIFERSLLGKFVALLSRLDRAFTKGR